MRPQSILLFERLYLASLAIGIANFVFSFDQAVSMVQNDPELSELGLGSGFVIATSAFSFFISLLLWYLIARRASSIAKWILVVLTALGFVFMLFDPSNYGGVAGAVTWITTILQLVALVFLFRGDARAWFDEVRASKRKERPSGSVTLK